MTRLAIVGGGIAGAAAASSARAAGAEVTVFDVPSGATDLTSGAADLVPWTQQGGELASPSREADGFLSELGYSGTDASEVATLSGLVRPTARVGPGVLDLSRVPDGACVLIADPGRAAFDARLLAAAYQASSRRGLQFQVLGVPELFASDERDLPLAALWRGFSAAHVARLEQVLRDARAAHEAEALLVGPWLGASPGVVGLSERSQMLVGETTSPPDGPAGPRLRSALRGCLQRAGVAFVAARVLRVHAAPSGISIVTAGEPEETWSGFERLILAAGGLVAGALGLSSRAGEGFTPQIELDLGTPSAPLATSVGSLWGLDAGADQGAFLRPGTNPGLPGELQAGRIYVAGDLERGSALTLLGAVERGLAVGRNVVP